MTAVHRDLSERIIGCAIEVHRELGPGLLENVYESALAHELGARGLRFRRQHPVTVTYKGAELEAEYWIDLLVEDRVIVELKAVESILPIHEAQLMTYLRLADKRLGLLINFNVPLLKDGITRRVL